LRGVYSIRDNAGETIDIDFDLIVLAALLICFVASLTLAIVLRKRAWKSLPSS